jgi:hypothetical protein
MVKNTELKQFSVIELKNFLKNNNFDKPMSQMNKEELIKNAVKINNQNKKGGNVIADLIAPQGFNTLVTAAGLIVADKLISKKNRKVQKGGQESSGQTSMPARWYNPNAPMPSSRTDMNSAYGKIVSKSFPDTNLAPYPNSTGQQTGGKNNKRNNKKVQQKGGEETRGATFLPMRWFNPNAPLPKPNNVHSNSFPDCDLKPNPVFGPNNLTSQMSNVSDRILLQSNNMNPENPNLSGGKKKKTNNKK